MIGNTNYHIVWLIYEFNLKMLSEFIFNFFALEFELKCGKVELKF